MATFFSLYDGDLWNDNVFGVTSYDVIDSVPLDISTSEIYTNQFTGNNTSLSAIAIQVNFRSASPAGTLILDIATTIGENVRYTYNISSFTNLDGRNNLLGSNSRNWQVLRLGTPLYVASTTSYRLRIQTTNASQITLVGSTRDTTFNYYGGGGVTVGSTVTAPIITSEGWINFDGGNNSVATNCSNMNKYLIIPNSTNVQFGVTNANLATTSFTVEGFVYFTGSGDIISIFKDGCVGSSWFSWGCQVTGTYLLFTIGSGTAGTSLYQEYDIAASTPLNQWNHFAFVKSGVSLYIYLNGTRLQSFNMSTFNSGKFKNNSTLVYIGNASNDLHIGRNNRAGGNGASSRGLLNNFRITGAALYTGATYTVPNGVLLDIDTSALLLRIPSPSFNVSTITSDIRALSATPYALGNIHICSSLSSTSLTKNISVTTNNLTASNLYVHNNATLSFPLTSSKTLTLNGSDGLQITSNGTLNIGTSSQYVPLSTNHSIILSNSQIDIHNGGTLNVFGAPKTTYDFLSVDVLSGSNTFTTINDVSSKWAVNDNLVFMPNTVYKTGFDTLVLSSFISDNTFTTRTSSTYIHYGLSSFPNAPLIGNLNRNIIIRGTSSANRATIRCLSAGKMSLNNALLSNFGINTTNKTGLIVGTNSSGSVKLSGCVINADVTNSSYIYFTPGSIIPSINITDNIFINGKNGISLLSASSNSLNLYNNLILNTAGGVAALQVANITANNSNIYGNYIIGSVGCGLLLQNNSLTGNLANVSYNNTKQGMILSSTNLSGSISGSYIYCGNEGIYINALSTNLSNIKVLNTTTSYNSSVGFKLSGNTTPITLNIDNLVSNNNNDSGIEAYNININLSSSTLNNNNGRGLRSSIANNASFTNVTANNNNSIGLQMSNYSLSSYMSPVVINITNSEMSNNSGAGIEAYNITGTFSGLAVNNNLNYGIKTSIGNGVTIFDKLTSITPTYTPSADTTSQSLVILSGYNYNKTVIRNSILSASSTNPAASASVALSMDSTRFSEFSLENTTLSAGIPLKLTALRNLLEGSYLFNNSLVGNTPLGSGITNIYQPNAIRATGFAFTSINKINGNHVTYFVGGQRMLDYVTPSVTLSDVPSEKLIPSSASIKLRSGSKYVALDKFDTTTVSVYVRKSIIDDGSVYNGNNPRLILVRNPSMGVYNDIIIDTLSLTNDLSGSFVQLIGSSPTVTDNGVLEYYVDCDGTTGWINIDKWETV